MTTRPFYRHAIAAGGAVWTPAYPFWRQPGEPAQWGVSHAIPVPGPDGRPIAVCGADVGLDGLQGYLRQIAGEVTGYACVAEERTPGDWHLIAHPRLDPAAVPGIGLGNRPDWSRDDPALGAYLTSVDTPPVRERLQRNLADYGRRVATPGGGVFGSVRLLDRPDQPRWGLVLLMPEQEVMRDVLRSLHRITLATGLFLAVAGIGAWRLAARLTTPLAELARDADAVSRLEFDDPGTAASPVREIRRLQEAMAGLRASLRSFRKYVPVDVVHELFQQGAEARLGGREAELTILFTDIAGFTATAESLPAQALVEHLGEYLAEASRVIHDGGGVVDKFIGDAVLAFWGAPAPVRTTPARPRPPPWTSPNIWTGSTPGGGGRAGRGSPHGSASPRGG